MRTEIDYTRYDEDRKEEECEKEDPGWLVAVIIIAFIYLIINFSIFVFGLLDSKPYEDYDRYDGCGTPFNNRLSISMSSTNVSIWYWCVILWDN